MEVPEWGDAEPFPELQGAGGFPAAAATSGPGPGGPPGHAPGPRGERERARRERRKRRRAEARLAGAVDLSALRRGRRPGGRGSGPEGPPPAPPGAGEGGEGAGAGGNGPTKKRKEKQRGPKAAADGPRPAAAGPAGGRAPAPQSKLLSKMQRKLSGAQFRWLNEKMYTCPGAESFRILQGDPGQFEDYHAGFRSQTAKWPVQPIDVAIAWVKGLARGAAVADFGCGDAKLAASVPHRVRSFDLVSVRPEVEACNMAATPLGDASVDAAVFCLALMGTDYGAFLREAARALRPKGRLWIAEVRSRYEFVDGGDGPRSAFVDAVCRLGFALRKHSADNRMFVQFEFVRRKGAVGEVGEWPPLKACSYKKR